MRLMKSLVKHTKTAGGVVVNGDKVVVVSQHGNSWSLPKGHVEQGEDEQAAARREIVEETGLTQLDFIKELGQYERYAIGAHGQGEDISKPKTIIMFLFHTRQTLLRAQDPTNPEARWVPKNEVAALLTHPKDKEFFLRIKAEI